MSDNLGTWVVLFGLGMVVIVVIGILLQSYGFPIFLVRIIQIALLIGLGKLILTQAME